MGPVGWLLLGWIVGPFLLLWWFAVLLAKATVLACRAVAQLVGILQTRARRS